MKEVSVAETASLCCSGHMYRCSLSLEEDKTRAARRRRMEIRRFKLIANASTRVINVKRLKVGNGVDVADRGHEEATECHESVAVGSLPSLVFAVGGDGGEPCPEHGVVSICGRRREMEDAVAVMPSFVAGNDGVYHFFGVYDGHGGSQAALYCKDRLHVAVAEEIRLTEPVTEAHWEAVMTDCFLKIDVEVAALSGRRRIRSLDISGRGIGSRQVEEDKEVPRAESKPPENAGSTAVLAIVGSRQIVVANCGDSRAVLCRGGKAIPLSTDHKPDRADEMARIESAGGRVIYWNGYRVLGVLAMSRAIGDGYLKPYVIAEPEVSFTARTEEDECLILASDGLWDVISNQVACEVSRKCLAISSRKKPETSPSGCPAIESPAANTAALLTKLALSRGSSDNISVVVVDLRKP